MKSCIVCDSSFERLTVYWWKYMKLAKHDAKFSRPSTLNHGTLYRVYKMKDGYPGSTLEGIKFLKKKD